MRSLIFGFGCVATIAALARLPLSAQQVPVVTEVSNYVWFGGALSPGVLAEVHGYGFSADAVVEVGGRRATVTGFSPTSWVEEYQYLFILIPVDLTPGPATVVVMTSDGASSPFPITLQSYALGLFSHFIGGGGRRYPTCEIGGTPSPGEALTAQAVGLGPTHTNGATVATPVLTIGGQPVDAVASVASDRLGVYNIRFRAPDAPGSYEVVLSIGDHRSNVQSLIVGNAVLHGVHTAAPEKVITAAPCGSNLATATATGDPRHPPTSLAGTRVVVRDAAGAERLAQLLYVSPRQVNYIVPSGTAVGTSRVTITSGDGIVSSAALEIRIVAPHLFTSGVRPAAVVVRVRDGVQTIELVLDTSPPIDVDSDQMFLLLFGTGLRFARTVSVNIGGANVPLDYAGPQGEYPGLDQVNVRLPRTLAGIGTVDLILTADGEPGNLTRLSFR